ncbi:MAG: hypothetical protein ACOC7R_03030, partial [Planctomycetota bacterium]
MRNRTPGADPLVAAVRAARAATEALAALRELYDDVDAALATMNQSCRACGRCCDFDAYGHRLYVTTLELALLTADPPPAPAAATAGSSGRCPYQRDAVCTARARRALGCRVFSCDPATDAAEHALYARIHDRLRRLHAAHSIPYL